MSLWGKIVLQAITTCAITLVVIHMTLPAAAADKSDLPSWAVSAIDSAKHNAADRLIGLLSNQNHDAVYLLNEEIVTIDGKTASQEYTERVVMQISNRSGIRYTHDLAFFFNNQIRIQSIKAWTLKPDDSIVELSGKDIHETPLYADFVFYSDSKVKTFSMPDVDVGDLFIYEVKTTRGHPAWTTGFSGRWNIRQSIPVYIGRFTLNLPEQWSYAHRIYNMPDQQPVKKWPATYIWTWTDVAPYSREAMVRADLSGGYLRYNCVTTDPAWTSRNRASWADHAAHYEQLSRPRLDLNEEMKQTVAHLTAGLDRDIDKIRAIADYVRNSLTYVAVEVGVGGYQPHYVQDIFKNKYGDCKDMASVLISMLGEAGIPAYPALIRTIDQGAIDPAFPIAYFNHCIAYVPITDVTEDWIGDWPEQNPFGRGLWVDATSTTSSIRDLPWTVQGAYALVVTPDQGRLLKTPVFGSDHNREIRSGFAKITATGDMRYEGEEAFSGNRDMTVKLQLRQGTDKDRIAWIQNRLGSGLSRCNLEAFNYSSLMDLNTPMHLTYQFNTPGFMSMAGNLAFFNSNMFNRQISQPFKEEERAHPVFLRYPISETDSLHIQLPAAYEVDYLPEPVLIETEFGRLSITFTLQDDTLLYVRKLRLDQREIQADVYDALKAFYKTMIKTDKAQVVMKKRPTANN